MSDVASFSEIEDEFMARVRRIVWCSVATVDRQGRPRQRILHPVWEGSTGWIATNRHSLKEKILAQNPNVALSYWDAQQQNIYIAGTALWEDRPEEKRRIWELFCSTPPPLGYDPKMIWSAPDDGAFGVLKITPRRIELSQMTLPGTPPRVWRAAK